MSQVRKRKGGRKSYRYQYTVGGERFSKTFDTAADRDAFKRELKRRRTLGAAALLEVSRPPLSFNDLAREWVETRAGQLSQRTLKDYSRLLRQHIAPYFGSMFLFEIDLQAVERFKAKLIRDGRGDSQTRQALVTLQAIMQAGKEWGYIPANPVRDLKKPATARKTAVVIPTPRQIENMRAVFEAQGRPAVATLTSVLAYLGLRPQEAFALEWRHIGERSVVVEQKNIDGRIVSGQKTKRPPRAVPVPEPVAEDLARWRELSETNLLFPALRSREAMRDHDVHNMARKVWKPVRDDVAPGTTMYTCRHACASLHIHSGERSPAEIAQIMGHSIQTLLTRYTHVYAEAQDRLPVDEAIRRARQESPKTHHSVEGVQA